MKFCAMAASMLFLGGAAASAQTRIAFSDRLGVEIMADSPAWCAVQTSLKVVARSNAVFTSADLATLIQRLGSTVITRECPSARSLDLTGVVAGQGQPVWHGTAQSANNWAMAPVLSPTSTVSTDLDAMPGKPPAAAVASATTPAPPPPAPPQLVPPPTMPTPTVPTTNLAAPVVAPSMPQVTAPEAAPSTTAATQPPPNLPPTRPGAGTPLFGEWSGRISCNSDKLTATLSVYEAVESHFQAALEIEADQDRTNAGRTRMLVSGVIDQLSGQFNWTLKEVVRTNGTNWRSFRGTLAPSGTISLEHNCMFGGDAGTLIRVGPSPILAERILADAERRRTLTAEALARNHPARLVGDQPQQPPRQPGCEELLAWAQSAPLDLRVTLVGGFSTAGTPGMLRHYDDSHSAPVFGTPLYWLFKSRLGTNAPASSINLRQSVDRTCPYQTWGRDPRLQVLRDVASDNQSQFQLSMRHLADDLADQIPVEIATTGGSAAETYRDLSPLTDPAKVAEVFANLTGENRGILSDANKQQIVADAKRLREGLASHAVEDLRAELAALPDTVQGLARVTAISDRTKTTFAAGAAAAPALAEEIEVASKARRQAIAGAMLARAQSDIAAAPPTLAGLHQAADLAQAASPQILPHLPDAPAKLQTSVSQHAAQAWPAVLAAEIKAATTAPTTVQGLQQLVARRAELVTLAGAAAPAGFSRYLSAIDAKAQEVGASAKGPLKQSLATLQPTWADLAAARQQASAAAAPFGETQVGKELREMGEARVAELLPPLADAALATVRSNPAKGLDQVARLAFQAEEAAAPFRADKAGAAQADRIVNALRKESADKAVENLKPYKETLRAAPVSWSMALRMARAAMLLDRAVVKVPGLAPYGDATRDAAVQMYASACTKAAADGNISSSDAARPMLIGRAIGTLGGFLCDIRDAGIKAGGLEKPGFFSSATDSVLKLYVPDTIAGLASANMAARLQETFMGRAAPTARDADPFDFLANPPQATAAAPVANVNVQRIVLREVEVSPGQRAWVGVQFGDEAKMEAMSIPQWREASEQMASLARGTAPDANTCATFRRKPADLDPAIAAQALLTCPAKP